MFVLNVYIVSSMLPQCRFTYPFHNTVLAEYGYAKQPTYRLSFGQFIVIIDRLLCGISNA